MIRTVHLLMKACIVVAVLLLALAIFTKATGPFLYYWALSLLLAGFIASLAHMFLLRLPVRGQGDVFTFDSAPWRYRFYFFKLIAVCIGLIFSLLHALV